jgi:hypothetical protein
MAALLVLFLSVPVLAGTVFSDSGSYPVNPEWKDSAPAIRTLKDARYDSKMNFTSFDPGSNKPSFTNQTLQKLSWKKLPAAKGEAAEKFELLFEDYRSQSKVQIFPGMPPMNTNQDFGGFLSSKPLKISALGGVPNHIENLETVRAQLSNEVSDPVARAALMVIFQENILLDGTRSFLQENSCLKDAGKKAIGASWKANFEANGVKSSTDCRFEGWAEAGGQRVLVFAVSVPKSIQETKLPMGKVATVETEGGGKLYFEPKSRESLSLLEMNITQLPPANDPNGARGVSTMKSSAHGTGL